MTTTQEEPRGRGRPVTFDRDELIDQVMHMFWERGYTSVSLNEIAHETGLTRASLYNSFGSKDALFLLTLDHYKEISPDHILWELGKNDSVAEALQTVLEESVRIKAKDKLRRGCFYTNSVNELVSQNIPVRDQMKQMVTKQKKMVKALITRAVKQKELPPKTDIGMTTNLLISFMHGLSTYSRTGASKADMTAMCNTFYKHLGFKAS